MSEANKNAQSTDEQLSPVAVEVLKQIATSKSASKSVAPRDIAQALATGDEDWRKYLKDIKAEAMKLAADGRLVFLRKRKVTSPEEVRGVYRFGDPKHYEQLPAEEATEEAID